MGAMRALCLAILLCAACAKKPAAQAPAPPPTATESKEATPGGAPADMAPAPAAQPPPKSRDNPCSGGERK
jgi:hypothetical protein